MADRDSARIDQAAMEDPITVSLGPMDRLLRRLHSLMASEHSLPEGLSAKEIRLLKEGLEGLRASLKDLSEAQDPSFTAKCWMEEVRALCYDTEDHLDEADTAAGAPKSIISWIHSKLKRRPRIADDFSELMARVADASEIHKNQLAPRTTEAGASRLTTQLSLQVQPPVSAAAPIIAGVEEPMNKLISLLAFDDDNQKQLKVVPVFGSAGLGKTTLARTIYRKFEGKFQCRAFLRVSRNPDMRRLLTSILSQIKAPPGHFFSDVQDLLDDIRAHLRQQGKRYFIIIDDLWTTSVWDIISRAFPDGDCCSRIITTTQIEDVALACCSYQLEYIFKMGPLNDDQSEKLLSHDVPGSEGGCTNTTSEGKGEVLNLIYNNLPLHLKTCLLYVAMYAEGHTIPKDDLVKQWVVEGFIGTVKGQGTEEIAEVPQNKIVEVACGYFDELVSRGMIQPVDTNYKGEVLSCTVHHMVLDLIKYKSKENNFIVVVDNFQSTLGHPDKVRRLSVQFGGEKGARIPESIILSQVRSLTFCGFFECVPPIVDYGLLRVLILHIWADQDMIFDLTRIGELHRLRYLKIECNITVQLPDEIRGLQYLETLQVHARVPAVPLDIVHLPCMTYLSLPSDAGLPTGIRRMTSLRTLGNFDLSSNPTDNVMDLGDLTNLQDLHLTCSTLSGNLEDNMEWLGLILGKLSSLKCLTLVPAGSSHVNTLSDPGASSMGMSFDGFSMVFPPPALLQRLELSRRCCIFPSPPKWFGELSNLCILKIAVRRLSREDIDILKRLPALTALSLYVWTAPAGWIIFDEGFPVLTYFKFMCTAPCLSFVEGAMPNVRKLRLGFNPNRMKLHSLVDAGFKCLTGLREISLKLGGAGADESDRRTAESALQAAVGLHPNRDLISRVQCVDVIFDGEGDTRQGQEQLTLGMHQDIEDSKMEHPSKDVNEEIDSGISTKSESSSHLQNPVAEQKTVARAMEGGMVSASTGAMDSVLRKLTVLMENDYRKLRGKREKVMFLKKELDAMHTILEHLADMPGLNMEMKRMRNQMKEMTYEVEDWIDDLMLKSDGQLHKRTTGYPEKWDALQEFIDQIRNLTAQAEKADLLGIVERTEIQTLQSSYKATESGLHTLYNKAVDLVSIDGSRDELVKRMNGGEQQLQVACILGSGGLGKTTLATEVYNHIKGPFDCRVFIKVPRKMDITRLHKVILRQHRRQLQARYYRDNMDEASQIDKVRRYLRDKRYLIVIDGVWSAQTWEVLKSALPENKRGSRILVTTDDRDIAQSCKKHSSDFTYCMLPLPPRDSIRLFRGILFGSDRGCPMELEKVTEKILAACGGIPMAIIIMAGILASKPAEAAEWEMVEKRMEPAAGDGDHAKEIIRKLFDISYSGLPHDMKPCLLYLSVFPENQFIKKDRLIWRWIAEGFVPKRSGESSWETGERYFLELIARNLIEPVYEDEKDDYEVPVGCKVHGLILEFITSLSNEENLVTTTGEATHVQHDVIRRLTVNFNNQEEDHYSRLISTQRLSKVRSITILEGDQRVDARSLDCWRPLLLGSRFLRVLDLEDAKSLRDHHLEGTIGGLVLLRYLGLAGTRISQLPEQIGKVEQLETLDLRRNRRLRTLPASIASLRKLARLIVNPLVHLPSEISKMQELEQVSTIDADRRSSLNSVAELLVKSKPLRMLDVILGGKTTETYRQCVMSFLKVAGNSNLQCLSIDCRNRDREDLLDILLDSWEVPPRHLRTFKLSFRIRGVVPPRMAYLVSVTHLDIWISELEAGGVRVLGDLPNLVLLKLVVDSSTMCVISGEKAFQCLKVFTLWCFFRGMGLEFTPRAMPQLQRLRLHFSARETLSLYGCFDFGIQHLSCLTRVHATINCFDATVSEVEAAEAAIRKQVSEFPIKPTTKFSRENEDEMREDEGPGKLP